MTTENAGEGASKVMSWGVIVGIMLAVDRPLDMLRTMVNITSDSVGAAIIAKSEGESEVNAA